MHDDPIGKIVELTQEIEKRARFLPHFFAPKVERVKHNGRIVSVTYEQEDCDHGAYYVDIPTFTIQIESGDLIYATPNYNYTCNPGFFGGHVRPKKKSLNINFSQSFVILNV